MTDPEAAAAALVAAGGARLGPTERHADGSARAVLRDPFGAVLALASGRTASADTPVRWHVLNVDDPERALAVYAGAFGWTGTEGFDAGAGPGRHLSFTWQTSGRSVGTIADTARLPHVHPHWLFLFDVPDVEHAVATVLAHDGTALPTFRTPTGDLAAVCEDPQGAMFGLRRPGTEKI